MPDDLNPTVGGDFGSLAISDLLPERPALIGEFSLAYEAFREATIADLAPVTKYEYLQALQLADLNWAILQAKASAEVELSTATERTIRAQLNAKLEGDGEREYRRQLMAFVEAGGEEDDFEDPVDWDAIDEKFEGIMAGLKSRDPAEREAATAKAIALGVDPRLVLSSQLLNNSGYRRHSEKLPDLEKRARLLSAEYREVQKSRPIDVVPVSGE
ncbi:hypothetical protein N9X16_00125 [Planktomarina temperata]|nr:hypothetical protein [Planktomarina temperata]